ncbi:hypothetical protein O7A70_06115 [Mesorhizobium sp. Cs1299R1N1]|uniref:hypothetical protein n=1 Tax=unclassified Mesorhizobium TaxID=325217 RepID=UPI00301B7688
MMELQREIRGSDARAALAYEQSNSARRLERLDGRPRHQFHEPMAFLASRAVDLDCAAEPISEAL